MGKRLKKLLSCLGVIFIIIVTGHFILPYILPHIARKLLTKEKYSFTNTEISTIAEKIGIDCNEIQTIEKIYYSEPRDTTYVIYTTLNSTISLEKNYKFTSLDNTIKNYRKKNNDTIFCELTENTSSYNATFYIYDYDEELTHIMKQN